MISMDDVAVKAGVSKATVSRVLNGKNPVSPKARKKVLTACKSLNYRMNANIQDLILKSRNGFTRNLAFVMVDVSFSDPAYSPLVDTLAEEVGRLHYQLSLVKLTGQEKTIYDLPPLLRDIRADGLLVSGIVTAEILNLLREMQIPIVVIGNYDPEILNGVSCVFSDREKLLRELIGNMIAAGCRKFAFAEEIAENFCVKQELSVQEKILKDYSLSFTPELIYRGTHRFSGIIPTLQPVFMQEFLPFDAIITTNFRLALEISHLICARFGFRKEYPVKLGTFQRSDTISLPVTAFYTQINQRKQCQAAMEQLIKLLDNSGLPTLITA